MDSYQYQPINLGRPSIRLLQLYKGDWSDKIEGHFISAWFDDPDSFMPYSALSYTWGYIDKVEEVTIDSARIKVTSNLHMALQHLRSGEEDQIFWIDALCINQENVHEKIHQISQMGDIYKKAEKVVVWLGRGTEETDLVMDSMKRLRKASLGWNSAEWKDKASSWVDENNEYLTNSREQMRLILKRPWFRRIWILSIGATIFSQFPALIALKPAVHCQSVLDIMPGISRKESWWAQSQKLHTLLVKFRESEATDDRDKIYALLGMSSDAHRSNILDPKCDKSSQQVIREAISFILSERYPQLVDYASIYQFLNWNLTKFLDNVEGLEGSILMDVFEGAEENFLKLFIETDVCQLSSRGFHDRVPVHWAIQKDRLTILKMLLDAYLCSFEKKDSDKQKPLSLVIQTGDAKIVELVLKAGPDIEATCLNGFTPLFLAIERNKINIVELLLRKGAKYGAQNKDSPEELAVEELAVATIAVKKKVTKRDIKKGRRGSIIPISSISTQEDQLPLSFAIEVGNLDVVKLLLKHGARLEDKDLLLALKHGSHTMVEFLVDYRVGKDISRRGEHLQSETMLGNINLITAFIKMGFPLESKNEKGQTPLMLAVVYGHYEIIKLLLESGAEIHSKDLLNQTPLEMAIRNGNKGVVELLLHNGADLEREFKDCLPPLLMATEVEHYDIVELLLQRGADIEARGDLGRTALSLAAWYGVLKIVRLLLENGADLETKDHMGRTPLQNVLMSDFFIAISAAQKGVVRLLLENGAELETRDWKGKTPLQNLKASNW
ncbi:hypothetical protein BOTNAR_0705g00020 [Botryotinia narcissicola]|uniref:Heterokaryon incompatibility domain-containing protein n=1 Tax=Botryotinia narcissicola TaxID=278944 RepID=A0A4Z1H7E6_9HELO|nr:hypothetical protein BOTNAR_0705g00020 [Botryotinia narcissicola]